MFGNAVYGVFLPFSVYFVLGVVVEGFNKNNFRQIESPIAFCYLRLVWVYSGCSC
jgi:hypothetical protein